MRLADPSIPQLPPAPHLPNLHPSNHTLHPTLFSIFPFGLPAYPCRSSLTGPIRAQDASTSRKDEAAEQSPQYISESGSIHWITKFTL